MFLIQMGKVIQTWTRNQPKTDSCPSILKTIEWIGLFLNNASSAPLPKVLIGKLWTALQDVLQSYFAPHSRIRGCWRFIHHRRARPTLLQGDHNSWQARQMALGVGPPNNTSSVWTLAPARRYMWRIYPMEYSPAKGGPIWRRHPGYDQAHFSTLPWTHIWQSARRWWGLNPRPLLAIISISFCCWLVSGLPLISHVPRVYNLFLYVFRVLVV